jgi:hypothetical protein
MNTPPHRRVRPLHQTPPGTESPGPDAYFDAADRFDATPYGTPLAEPQPLPPRSSRRTPPPLPQSRRTPRPKPASTQATPSTIKTSGFKLNEHQGNAKRSLEPALAAVAGNPAASSAVANKPPAQVAQPSQSTAITSRPPTRVVVELDSPWDRQNQIALQLYGRVAKGALKHVVAPVARGALKHVVAPVARGALKHVAAPVARGALKHVAVPGIKHAGRALLRGVATAADAEMQLYDNNNNGRLLIANSAPAPNVVQVLRPQTRTVSTTAPQLARTVSTAARADRLLIEDKAPASIIDANEESDMPPKQGSDMRPDIARRELMALYERYAPAKLDDPGYLDGLLSKYTGRYDQLLRLVRARYEPTSTASTAVSAPDEPDATPRKAAAVTSAQIENPGPVYNSPQHPPPPPTPVRATPRSGRTHIEATVSNASFMTALSHSTSAPRTGLLTANTLLDATQALKRSTSIKPAVEAQETEAARADPQTAAAASDALSTQASATAGMDALAKAAATARGASPETLVSLYEELQRNPQLRQLAASGLLNWSDLMSDKHETLPDGSKARVIDATKLLALQQRLSTLASKEAGKLQNIQEVAVQRRTVPGPKAPERSAIYPGVSVFMYPRELPATRPGQ